MFESDYEYLEFRVWATTGTCQVFRMLSSLGEKVEIPSYWQELKSLVDKLPAQIPDYLKSENYV
jgi:hypothetical protein